MNKDIKDSILSCIAPVVGAFTAWTLYEARRCKIKRLYYLSRDGYALYHAALAMAEGAVDLDIRYLSVSRYALRIPELALVGDSFPEWLFNSGIDVTMNKIMMRIGLGGDECLRMMKIIGFNSDPDRVMNRDELLRWKDITKKRWGKLIPLFEGEAQEQLDTVKAYLKQEGLYDDLKIAVVDSGWVGTTLKSLQNILGREDLEGFYFGLYGIPKDAVRRNYHAFYFAPDLGIARKAYFSNCLFEVLLSEPAGMTVGYEIQSSDKHGAVCYPGIPDHTEANKMEQYIIPVHSDTENPNSDKLKIIRTMITEYAMLYGQRLDECGVWKDETDSVAMNPKRIAAIDEIIRGDEYCERILKRFMYHPTVHEAEWFGSLKFCDDMTEESGLADVASPLTYEDIRNLRLTEKLLNISGIRRRTLHESAWIYASIVRCGRAVSRNLRAAARYRMMLYLRMSFRRHIG